MLLIVRLPAGFAQLILSPTFALNNKLVNLPGRGLRTHLITNSKNFLFSGDDAIEYARLTILLSRGNPRVKNWPALKSGTPFSGVTRKIPKSSRND